METVKTHIKMCDAAAACVQDGIARGPDFSRWYQVLPICRAVLRIKDNARGKSIVLVRSGSEQGPSEPVEFSSTEQYALPLARPDCPGPGCTVVIRFLIAQAVQYFYNIQHREDSASPEAYEYLADDKGTRRKPDITFGVGSSVMRPKNQDEFIQAVFKPVLSVENDQTACIWKQQQKGSD